MGREERDFSADGSPKKGGIGMTLQDWANVATIIGVLSIPLSGYFIWLQLRQQTLLARAANAQSLVELSSPFNLQLIQDPKMAEYWVHGAERYSSFDQVEQYRYKSLLIWWLILHENIFFQQKNELLDDAVYAAWQRDLESFAQRQLKEQWPGLKWVFQPAFAKHVESLMKSEPVAVGANTTSGNARSNSTTEPPLTPPPTPSHS
jgi:hypothetical protein